MKTINSILILCLVLTPFKMSWAQEKTEKKPAGELLELMKFKELMIDVSNTGFAPILGQLRKQGFPEEGVKEIREIAGVYSDQVASDPGFKEQMTRIMQEDKPVPGGESPEAGE